MARSVLSWPPMSKPPMREYDPQKLAEAYGGEDVAKKRLGARSLDRATIGAKMARVLPPHAVTLLGDIESLEAMDLIELGAYLGNWIKLFGPPSKKGPAVLAELLRAYMGEVATQQEDAKRRLTPYFNKSAKAVEIRARYPVGQRCQASRGDGECGWSECPQEKNKRAEYLSTCPLVVEDDE